MPPDSKPPNILRIEFIVTLFIIIMLAMIAIPNFVKARTTRSRNSCAVYCMWIEAAKQLWARENKKSATDTPTETDLLAYLPKLRPKWDGRFTSASMPVDPAGKLNLNLCPAAGQITVGPVNQRVTCSITQWDEPHYLQNYPNGNR